VSTAVTLTEKIKTAWQSPKKRTKFIFVIGVIGMLLILLSELIPEKTEQSAAADSEAVLSLDECEEYKTGVENQLADIISQIRGVGDVKVMITVSGTKEYVYAEQSDINQQTESGSETVKQKNEIILADGNDEKQPVVKKIIAPQICGAVIVCGGADNPQTKERVLNAASAALGLPSSKISVEPSN
jgi:stage III sporulation protein AG